MNKLFCLIGLLVICTCVGCHSDIVTTRRLKTLEHKCVYIEAIESEDPHVGRVISDVISKEFIRAKVELCDPNLATIFISGTTFLTTRAVKRGSQEAVESISVVAKDRDGEILLTASYGNKEQYTASKLAKEFGKALAGKFK